MWAEECVTRVFARSPRSRRVRRVSRNTGSSFYSSEKANAEAMGYDTVENGDLSYPARP
jgi:hypothetical protein